MLHIEFSGVLEKHFCEIMDTLIAGAIFYCRTPYVLPTVKMSTKSVKFLAPFYYWPRLAAHHRCQKIANICSIVWLLGLGQVRIG
jgi:hypothetical protein